MLTDSFLVAIDIIIRVTVMVGFLLTTVLALIWIERKFIGHIQMRLGPMRTGYHGVLQPVADALKLVVKESFSPAAADWWLYRLAPFAVFLPAFLVFVTIPFSRDLVIRNLDMGLFYIVAVSLLSIVGVVMAGYGSANKYALLGGVRAAAVMVSYEIPMVLTLLSVGLMAQTLSLVQVVQEQSTLPFLVLQPLGLFIFLTAALAEVNRTPFDIMSAESEIVGGPFVEYSGMRWGIFFLAEYVNTFAICALTALLFLGGWSWPFIGDAGWSNAWWGQLLGFGWFMVKTYAILLFVFWLRATLPRLRVDQFMGFAWKVLMPLSFLNLLLVGFALMYGWYVLLLGWVGLGAVMYGIYGRLRSA